MARHKLFKSVIASALLAGVISSSVFPYIPVYAEESKTVRVKSSSSSTTLVTSGGTVGNPTPFLFLDRVTQGGVANFGRGTASITINGNGNTQSLIGKKFNVYKLFDAQNSVGLESINYTMNPDYAPALRNIVGNRLNKQPQNVTEYEIIDYIQSLNTNKVEGAHANQTEEGRYSDFRYFIEELRDEITRLGIRSDTVTVNDVKPNNSIEIAGLDFGYYIVDEVSQVGGSHSAASLCIVNTANPSASVQVKSDYPVVSKKIQEDDNQQTIGNNGWNDIGDYEIGQTVPYKFESNVPNMNGYHNYYYAWHDKMDPALTFDPQSVGIKIVDAQGKEYVLQNSEFKVLNNPGQGLTFKVVIDDLKAIVDREFPNMNANGENIYGQQVILTYNATLNDNAANDTGRPGFENDVKLEFSNNPDSNGNGSTGETPWDTVVCFTYKINGLKTNDHNTPLEDAQFRLYTDKACTNEVYVKDSPNGYIVINRDSAPNGRPADAVDMKSDANGVFTIIGLDQGTYYLKETKAPDGYRPLLDPIEITITPTFTNLRNDYIKGDGATNKTLQNLTATAKIREFWAGIFNDSTLNLQTDLNDGSMNITVVNKVGSKLPITGSSATLLLVGAGSTLMATSLVSSKRGKNKKDDEPKA